MLEGGRERQEASRQASKPASELALRVAAQRNEKASSSCKGMQGGLTDSRRARLNTAPTTGGAFSMPIFASGRGSFSVASTGRR